MKKTAMIIISVILIILLGTGIFFYNYFYSDKIEPAMLSFSEGDVQVFHGGRWSDAENNMPLSKKDKVKTGEGSAMITFYDSILVDIESGSEVSVEELSKEKVKVKQDKGSTWNKFTSITGIGSYEVETPNTVATVRGTEFGVDVEGEESSIMVLEGEVRAESGGEYIMLNKFQKAVKKKGMELAMEELTPEEKEMMLDKSRKMLDNIKMMRERVIESKRAMIENAMAKYDVSEDKLRGYLDKIDRGEIDDSKLIEKSPVKLPVMYRMKKINDEIKDQQILIKSLEKKISEEKGKTGIDETQG